MNIFRLYNQNRFVFWSAIVAIIVFLIILRLLNNVVIYEKNKPINVVIDEKLYENKISIEEQISDNEVKEEKQLIIDQFIRYCNAKNIQDAYNLLTDECREELFPTLDIFENNYIKLNFNTRKLYSKEIYYGSTYKIKFYENMLNTGVTNNTNEDYYTIITKNGQTKLNICNYIKRNKLEKNIKNNKVQIEIETKDSYMDYEIYKLKITNLTDKTMIVDTKENTKSIYVVDNNNVKYYAAAHEILDNTLKIKPKATNIVEIKYIKKYNSNSSKKIVFEDIIFDYIENSDLKDYERTVIQVQI